MNLNWKQVIIGSLFFIWAVLFPPTRAVIRFLLPLGSGWDDAVAIILIAVVIIVYLVKRGLFSGGPRTRWQGFKNFFND